MRIIDADKLQEEHIKDYGKRLLLIDVAPTVEAFTKEDMSGAYNEGYACGSRENKRPQGDLISRKHLYRRIKTECNPYGKPTIDFESGKRVLDIIDNEPTVDIKDQIAGAYKEGFMCGSKEAEKARPQGEYVPISKLRLMTVEECAGHTIDYAMGWKACIEWIKKGGAE